MTYRWTGALGVAVAVAVGIGSLAQAASRTGVYGPGAEGSGVRLIQTRLDELGYRIPVTGYFGPITDRAVRDFQRQHHLAASGIVNAATSRALQEATTLATGHLSASPALHASHAALRRYQVKAGDTLAGIAAAFHTTVATLTELNQLSDPGLLRVGQLLWVPDGTAAAPAPQASGAATRYTVQPGDTVFGIAEAFHVSVTALIDINHLTDPSQLAVGKVLLIPSSARPAPAADYSSAAPAMAAARLTLGEAIVSTALKYVGVPYVWGGESPVSGFDCSGLVQYVLAQNGISIGRTSWDQYQEVTPVPRADLQPGDLVFFTTYAPGASHVGIYMGADPALGYAQAFIDAPQPGQSVMVQNLDTPYWIAHFYGAGAANS